MRRPTDRLLSVALLGALLVLTVAATGVFHDHVGEDRVGPFPACVSCHAQVVVLFIGAAAAVLIARLIHQAASSLPPPSLPAPLSARLLPARAPPAR